jgi:hypothetical protein
MDSTVAVSDSPIVQDLALGGDGGGADGPGGDGQGGGIAVAVVFASATLNVDDSQVDANEARGGAGGGNGFGGGVYISAGAVFSLKGSTILFNVADGGEGPVGQGVGGGVYNLGTFDLDAASIVKHNHASTSNDNIFGPITPQ